MPSDLRNPALEAAIERDPFDRDAYLVYADWLEGQGDPRAKLIAVQCGRLPARNPDKEVRKLLADHRTELVGPIARFGSGVRWQNGFVHALGINDSHGPIARSLADVLAHPSTRFLVELALSTAHLADVLDALVQLPRTLRKLSIYAGDRAVSIAPLAPVLERLTTLSLSGSFAVGTLSLGALSTLQLRGPVTIAALDLPALELADLSLDPITPATTAAIATARAPRLRRLILNATSARACDLAPLFARDDLPAFAELALPRSSAADELCARLVESPLASRLRYLDLATSNLTDAGARTLATHRDRLARLEYLDVSECDLTEEGHAALDSMNLAGLDDSRYDDIDE